MTDDDTPYRVTCECGYDVLVTEGVYLENVSNYRSAQARRAGHMGGAGCEPEDVSIGKVEEENHVK